MVPVKTGFDEITLCDPDQARRMGIVRLAPRERMVTDEGEVAGEGENDLVALGVMEVRDYVMQRPVRAVGIENEDESVGTGAAGQFVAPRSEQTVLALAAIESGRPRTRLEFVISRLAKEFVANIPPSD